MTLAAGSRSCRMVRPEWFEGPDGLHSLDNLPYNLRGFILDVILLQPKSVCMFKHGLDNSVYYAPLV